jgi:hypothetical protein
MEPTEAWGDYLLWIAHADAWGAANVPGRIVRAGKETPEYRAETAKRDAALAEARRRNEAGIKQQAE